MHQILGPNILSVFLLLNIYQHSNLFSHRGGAVPDDPVAAEMALRVEHLPVAASLVVGPRRLHLSVPAPAALRLLLGHVGDGGLTARTGLGSTIETHVTATLSERRVVCGR